MKQEVGTMKQTANVGIGILLLLGLAGLPVSAQNQAPSNSQQGQSLGDYARQVRKEPDSAKAKPHVFDNDNLPKTDKLSVVGKATPTETAPEEKPADTNATTPAGGAEGKPAAATATPPTDTSKMDEAAKQAAWKQWGDRLKHQQETIDLLQRELDVLQREYQIRAAAMYADAGNRLRNSGDWDKQDSQYKQQIADKQKALDDAKQKLDDLQEQARKAGTPSSIREP
jgi:hypothetical protein